MTSRCFFPARARRSIVCVQRRLEPFLPAHAALVAERVRIGPAAARQHRAHRLLDLPLVRIAALDQAQRQAVRAEDQMHARRIVEMRQAGRDPLRHGLDVQRMRVKLLDDARLRGARAPDGTGASIPSGC